MHCVRGNEKVASKMAGLTGRVAPAHVQGWGPRGEFTGFNGVFPSTCPTQETNCLFHKANKNDGQRDKMANSI